MPFHWNLDVLDELGPLFQGWGNLSTVMIDVDLKLGSGGHLSVPVTQALKVQMDHNPANMV